GVGVDHEPVAPLVAQLLAELLERVVHVVLGAVGVALVGSVGIAGLAGLVGGGELGLDRLLRLRDLDLGLGGVVGHVGRLARVVGHAALALGGRGRLGDALSRLVGRGVGHFVVGLRHGCQ